MVETIEKPRRLSNVQALLLQLFERDLPESDLIEVKNMLSRFFFKKAQEETDKMMKEKGITIKQLEKEIDKLNNGSRTEYLKRIRKEKHESSH